MQKPTITIIARQRRNKNGNRDTSATVLLNGIDYCFLTSDKFGQGLGRSEICEQVIDILAKEIKRVSRRKTIFAPIVGIPNEHITRTEHCWEYQNRTGVTIIFLSYYVKTRKELDERYSSGV